MERALDKVSETLLMGPGPSMTYPSVYQAMAKPTLGHMDPRFIKVMDEIKEMLKVLFGTENDLVVPVSGTGSAGMETVLVNLIERGDPVLVITNGVFSERQAEVARRLGADVDCLAFPWGSPVDPKAVSEQLNVRQYALVSMVHAETSTGVCNPAAEVGELVHRHGALYVLDTVTSLGGMEISVDDWKVDAVYSGSQKCLSCPPGLSPVSMSSRALEKLFSRKEKVPNWYLDMSLVAEYWAGKKRTYHHTAPINMLYGLCQSLYEIMDEGLQEAVLRHQKMHEYLADGLSRLGIEFIVEKSCRLPMLNAVKVPEGTDDAEARMKLLFDHGIEIGAGLGAFAGKVWRIGLMGNTAREACVDRLLAALPKVMGQK